MTSNTIHPGALATYVHHASGGVCSYVGGISGGPWLLFSDGVWRTCYQPHLGARVTHLTDPISALPHARTTDDETSHAAAAAISNKTTMLAALLRQFAQAPMTAEQAATAAGYTAADGAWKRVSDLQRLGLIEPTEETRPGSSGRQQRVHQITTAGVRWRADHREGS